jgi:outer membrane protein assembly factor BamD (BamD/ComL family)
LGIGLCRLEQKRYDEAANALLAITFTYNYPDWVAPARCEAARAHMELKKPTEAARQWQQVLTDFPQSPWAEVARKGLASIK